jgi:integrase
MYRFRRDGISVLAIVDRRRIKNNGLYPVKIEVVYRRVQKYFPTGQDVSIDEWDAFWTCRRRPKKCVSIESSFYVVRNVVEQLAEKGEFSFRRLEARLGRAGNTVNEAIDAKMKSLMTQGKINSYYRYRSTLHGIERFAGRKISFDSLSVNWLRKCEAFWSKEGKNCTTINIYMKTLKSIFNQALENGIIHDGLNPFGKNGYEIPASSARKMALTKNQIEEIRRWKGNAEVEYYRDLWMFSYLCNGINFRDMLFLKYSDVCDGEIRFIRSKTAYVRKQAKFIHAPITPLMSEIMARSGNGAEGTADKYIFRHAKGNEKPLEVSLLVRKVISSCNAAMKILAADIGMPAFSTYAARHSFATVLKKSGTDISFISESLGHTSIVMTENYLAGSDKEERRKYAENLI